MLHASSRMAKSSVVSIFILLSDSKSEYESRRTDISNSPQKYRDALFPFLENLLYIGLFEEI